VKLIFGEATPDTAGGGKNPKTSEISLIGILEIFLCAGRICQG